jgi:hypothetical protein
MPLLRFYFYFCYMFHLSTPQSAVVNMLLMRYLLLHYLYMFHCSINTATLDVLRIAFAILTSHHPFHQSFP